MGRPSVVGVILVAAAIGAAGQSFDVASVKPDKSETGVDRIKISGGSLLIENVSLKRLIGMACGIAEWSDYLLSVPGWMDDERFDISAKAAPGTMDADVLVMLRRLLEDRFGLMLHRETREFSAYALIVAKGGAKVPRAAQPERAYMFRTLPGHASGTSVSMGALAGILSRQVFQLDRRVVDLTGLTGTFDVTLDWAPEGSLGDEAMKPSLLTALQEQFGLRLEARKIPLEVLVVDRGNRVPTAN